MKTRQPVASALHHNVNSSNAIGLFGVSIAVAVVLPGSILGAAVALMSFRRHGLSPRTHRAAALVCSAVALALHGLLAPGWMLLLVIRAAAPSVSLGPSPTIGGVALSLPIELLLGPAILVLVKQGRVYWEQTVTAQELLRVHDMTLRSRSHTQPDAFRRPEPVSPGGHPVGAIRLGHDAVDGTPFDITPEELSQHIFLPGNSGTGKTRTNLRLADGALWCGYSVVCLDCKGTGLGGAMRRLAMRREVPLTIVDTEADDTVGYDVCSGPSYDIANKLIGSFSFSADGEIYKQIAMEILPILSRGLAETEGEVTLGGIYDALETNMLANLGRRLGDTPDGRLLLKLNQSKGLSAAGYLGLQKRLGALMQGQFGELFNRRPALNWDAVIADPSITYVSLRVTAASEDVELFGRVLIQDLKQLASRRMEAIDRGADLRPVLLIIDEFAALRDPTQVLDLHLQARQARVAIVIGTQFLPDDASIRRAVLASGLIINHRLEAEDSEPLAAQFGTHSAFKFTSQIDLDTGDSQKGSVREVDEYNVHPNVIRDLDPGTAAVLSRVTHRRSIVRIEDSW